MRQISIEMWNSFVRGEIFVEGWDGVEEPKGMADIMEREPFKALLAITMEKSHGTEQ
jgi:hypothetical protein